MTLENDLFKLRQKVRAMADDNPGISVAEFGKVAHEPLIEINIVRVQIEMRSGLHRVQVRE